jgi:sialate O-acetylesterase
MIHPFVPLSVRGAIWYQGESNGGEGISYYQKMKALIQGWRTVFKQPDMSFYYVQLADFRSSDPNNPAGGDGWAQIRDAQRKALDIPRTGMAVIIDIGDARDIHPRNKQDVGDRLARWALNRDYGKDIVPSGPLYKSVEREGAKMRVRFDHVGTGLMIAEKTGLEPPKPLPDPQIKWIAVAGEDKAWHWARIAIDGETLLVWSDEVPEPVAVRYCFTMNPVGPKLYNKEGLPASPFRTDDW